VPIGKASVLRHGEQVTIVATANMVGAALAAADELAVDEISAEVIDPRSISPLDVETIAESVRKTGRLVIAHEAVEQGGIGSEITAAVQEHALYYLDAPILRVAAPFAPVPASPALEKEFIPGKSRIVEAVRKVIARA
jgi:acetoin:2,6-dichlorophenolindophenol oxidoreductase subunit beta